MNKMLTSIVQTHSASQFTASCPFSGIPAICYKEKDPFAVLFYPGIGHESGNCGLMNIGTFNKRGYFGQPIFCEQFDGAYLIRQLNFHATLDFPI
jgi:hypothetical protein